MDYIINPVLMNGTVKEIKGGCAKVHIAGRLGVITMPLELIGGNGSVELAGGGTAGLAGGVAAVPAVPYSVEPGTKVEFYFSFVWTEKTCETYDSYALRAGASPYPALLGGLITEVNDTACKIEVSDIGAALAVPRRWMFTEVPLEEGLPCEFYLSTMIVKKNQ